mmetsp:Transcript_60321/g.143700  ORF Transcript_60321/g.143700 Transcript_60321/m.143700 type:complete len:378 (-) Transcript_60321:77-1210(-)
MFSGLFRSVSEPAAAGGRKSRQQDGKAGKGKGKGSKGSKGGKGSTPGKSTLAAPKEDGAPGTKKSRRQRLKEKREAVKARKQAKKEGQKELPDAIAANGQRDVKSKAGSEATRTSQTEGKQVLTKAQKQSAKAKAAAAAEEKSSAAVLNKAAKRLQGARFRWLNEALYTTTGDEAKEMFEEDPSLAEAYHSGFRAQRAKWPRNPLDDVIKWLQTFDDGTCVGDFGCGEARIAKELGQRLKVHSFDIAALNEHVVPCNLANVPMQDGSLDVVVFCLALMGTDWPAFLREAYRCLKPRGICHIVEVESRFTDVQAVADVIQSIGFRQVLSNSDTFFVELRFVRVENKRKAGSDGKGGGKKRRATSDGAALLQSCTYKRR